MDQMTVLLLLLFTATQGHVVKRSDDQNPLDTVVHTLSKQVADNKAEIQVLKAKLDIEMISVSFHVEFTKDPVMLGPDQTFIFDRVISNAGKGYDAISGQFQAPSSGSYMFVVSFMGDFNAVSYVNVIVDGKVVGESISHGDGSHWDQVSDALLLQLKAGQRVWLQRGHQLSTVQDIRGAHWTTFSGFLIRPDSQDS